MGEVVTLQKHSNKEDLIELINDLPEKTDFMVLYEQEIEPEVVQPTFHFIGEMSRDSVLLSTYKLQQYLLMRGSIK